MHIYTVCVVTTMVLDYVPRYMVSAASWSKQLPTIILFQHGKESRRRPVCDIKGRVLAKFIFNEVGNAAPNIALLVITVDT